MYSFLFLKFGGMRQPLFHKQQFTVLLIIIVIRMPTVSIENVIKSCTDVQDFSKLSAQDYNCFQTATNSWSSITPGFKLVQLVLYILICTRRGLNLDLWVHKPLCYQLSQPCLFILSFFLSFFVSFFLSLFCSFFLLPLLFFRLAALLPILLQSGLFLN